MNRNDDAILRHGEGVAQSHKVYEKVSHFARFESCKTFYNITINKRHIEYLLITKIINGF